MRKILSTLVLLVYAGVSVMGATPIAQAQNVADFTTVNAGSNNVADFTQGSGSTADFSTQSVVNNTADFSASNNVADFTSQSTTQTADFSTQSTSGNTANFTSSSNVADFTQSTSSTADFSTSSHSGNVADFTSTSGNTADFTNSSNVADFTNPSNIADFTNPNNVADFTDPDNIADFTDPDNIADFTDPDNIADFTNPPQTARPSVTLLQSLNMTADSATLLYNGFDPDTNDVLTYNVCLRNVSQNGSNACFGTTNEFYQATGLLASTQYEWTVTASDAVGQGTTVNGPLSFTTLAQQPTNLPPTLTLTGLNATGDTSAVVSWEATNAEGTAGLQFDICYALDRNGVLNNCVESITGGNFYEINNLMAGTQYFVTVRVREGTQYTVYANNGPIAVTTTGTETNPTNRMPVVTLNPEQSITATSTNFSWFGSNQDANETFSYRFCLSSDLNALLQNCSATTSSTTATRSDLTANTTYYWTVQVSDGTFTNVSAGNGPRAFTTLTSGAANNAPTVQLTSPNNGATLTTESVTLTWQGSDLDNDALTYSLYVQEVAQGTTVDSATLLQGANRVLLNSTQTSYNYTVQNTIAARSIYWMVVVADAATTGESAVRTFVYQPQAVNVAPVVTLTSPANGSTQAIQNTYTLQWTGQDATALTYTVYAQEVDATSTVQTFTNDQIAVSGNVRISGTASTSYSLSVTPGRRVFWTVRASDGSLTSLPNNGPFRFDVVNTTQQNGITVQLDALDTNGNVQTSFPQNAQITTRLRLTNTTGSAQTLNFPTAQQYVFRVINVANGSVIRTSVPVAGFNQSPSSLTINAGQTQTITYSWDQRDSNGVLVPNGQYRIEGEVTTNPAIIATPVILTIGNGGNPTNTAPTFTSFLPTSGSNFSAANPIQLSWVATDANNDVLSYNLYLLEQSLGQTAPTLATVMASGNRVNIATSAVSHTFTPTLQREYFWAVTVSDSVNPLVVGGMPFHFTVNQNAVVNAGPTARLLTPGAQPTATAINYTTAGNRSFEWVTLDQDNPNRSTLMNRLYVYEVALSDTAQYTSAQIIANGTLRATTTAELATIATTDQRRYWWTVDATDGIVSTPIPAYNGPFTFTVNSTVTTPQSLVWDLVTANSSATNAAQQNTFSQNETIYLRASVRNAGTVSQTITFPNTNWLTVLATRVGFNQTAFTQVVSTGATSVAILPGQTYTLPVASWNGVNAATVTRNNGNYDITATLNALNYSATLPSRQITLYTSTSGGGGGGGGGSGGGGSGGGGSGVDISTPLLLPTTDTGARTWYGPINFERSNGEVKIDLNHVDYNSGFCAKWTKDTVVTSNGQRFTGSYTPIKRLSDSQIVADARTSIPSGAEKLYEYFLQYGNLNESYSKPVTICGTLPSDIRLKAKNQANIAILGFDPATKQWVKLGDMSNIADGRNFSVTIGKSMILAFYEVGGVIPGGNNGNTNGSTDPIGDDTFCREFGSPFTDTNEHWSDYYVCRLYRMGVVTGYMEGVLRGLFGPDRGITRAELTKILVEIYGYDVSNIDPTNEFRDISGDEWFAKYVVAAKKAGIVTGYSDGYFRPFRNINRAEAMKVILLSSELATQSTVDAERLSQMADSDNYAGFLDIPEDQWFTGFIAIGQRLGIISGKTREVFRAGDDLTRAEMAKIAFFVLELTDDQN